MGSRKAMMAVIALVEQGERLLLVQEAKPRWRGLWNLPGGRVEEGESLVGALEREVLEEAGLAVTATGLLYVDQLVADGTGVPNRLRFAFRAEVRAGNLKSEQDEHSLRAQWFVRDELPELALRARTLVERTLDASPSLLPMERVHLIDEEERERERDERSRRHGRD